MRIAARQDELETFKTEIDIRGYMASRGYLIDARQSSRAYSVMRNGSGEKLIVTRKANRHWIYANTGDDRDRGTIIDFIQLRDRRSLGEVRKKLRSWTASPQSFDARLPKRLAEIVPTEHNAAAVVAEWNRAKPINGLTDYLAAERELPAAVLTDPIFADRIRTGRRRNALMAHYSFDGLCGFEIKNRGFTGFATGGVKGLFCSRPRASDRELIVCETAIDALSYAALYGTEGKRFVSTAGQISPLQRKLLQSAAQKMPFGSSIVIATDNDKSGRKLAESITELLQDVEMTGKTITQHLPQKEGQDWNDVLRHQVGLRRMSPTPAA